jgi:hypothetical protein
VVGGGIGSRSAVINKQNLSSVQKVGTLCVRSQKPSLPPSGGRRRRRSPAPSAPGAGGFRRPSPLAPPPPGAPEPAAPRCASSRLGVRHLDLASRGVALLGRYCLGLKLALGLWGGTGRQLCSLVKVWRLREACLDKGLPPILALLASPTVPLAPLHARVCGREIDARLHPLLDHLQNVRGIQRA